MKKQFIPMNLQFFAGATGVTPVYALKFKISTSGRTGEATAVVKDAESLSIGIDGNIVEWTPMDQDGWTRRLMTGKSITVSMGGKRNYGDAGNDYVASLAFKNGQDCNSKFAIEFPDGATLSFDCVINVTSIGGESTDGGALEWEAQSDGAPTYTAPVGE